jgi:hypothetical protein
VDKKGEENISGDLCRSGRERKAQDIGKTSALTSKLKFCSFRVATYSRRILRVPIVGGT